MDNRSDYREQALKLLPWLCAHCGREFDGKRIRELTVHHKDHNHDNNPPDGSNWELLCIYCHEHEHAKFTDVRWQEGTTHQRASATSTHNPFAGLKKMLEEHDKK